MWYLGRFPRRAEAAGESAVRPRRDPHVVHVLSRGHPQAAGLLRVLHRHQAQPERHLVRTEGRLLRHVSNTFLSSIISYRAYFSNNKWIQTAHF